MARAKVACAAGLEADGIRRVLEPTWQTQIPEGLNPCLPEDVLKVYSLATHEFRLMRKPPKVAMQSNRDPTEFHGESNNWVISAAKSATGRAILASDPHLEYSQPSVRYLLDLNSPTLHVIGATRPESPGVMLGHNDWIAFGSTSFPIDEEDLYVYELNPANPDQYKYKGQWESFQVVHETIKVKGQGEVPVELKFSRHGPVVYVEKEKGWYCIPREPQLQ